MLTLQQKAQRLDDAAYISRRYILALATYREARGESLFGKQCVAQVIENRVQDDRWPQTYDSVILQPWQFSSFNASDPNSKLFPPTSYSDAWGQCWEVAGKVLDEDSDITEGCNHYFADYIKMPKWAEKMTHVLTVGKHKFYRA